MVCGRRGGADPNLQQVDYWAATQGKQPFPEAEYGKVAEAAGKGPPRHGELGDMDGASRAAGEGRPSRGGREGDSGQVRPVAGEAGNSRVDL